MSRILPLSPFVVVSDRLVQLETMVRTAHATEDSLTSNEFGEVSAAVDASQRSEARWSDALNLVQDLRRWFDRINFLYDTTRQLRQILTVREVLALIVETIWQRQYSFIVILLGETELGPYYYEEMRGVVDPRRYLGKQCPLPLWGELAHALVRRLDSDEPDYLIIDDLQTSGRPKPDEFPWLEREGAMMIVPLRRNGVAFGAMILGRPEIGGFHDPALCAELLEIGETAASAVHSAQTRLELQNRADQLVGLQLFAKSLSGQESLEKLLNTVVRNVADLLRAEHAFLLLLRDRLPQRFECLQITHGAYHPWLDLCVIYSPAPGDEVLSLPPSLYRLVMWTIEAGQALFLNPDQVTASPEDLYYNEVGRALLAPLAIGDQAIGAIYAIASPNDSDFDESDMVVARTIANSTAAVVHLMSA